MKVLMTVAAILAACFFWGGESVSIAGEGRDVSAVNASVQADARQAYGALSTVNGDVRVGPGATADSASTVNGSIRIDGDARVGQANTVNGSLRLAEGASVQRHAHTVNGDVQLRQRSRVGGDVSTVSGEIELEGAEVGGALRTVNGDIDLQDGSRVRGGIVVQKSKGWSSRQGGPVRVHVCSTCVVDGELRFERPVELVVDQGGQIGRVIGDEVTRR